MKLASLFFGICLAFALSNYGMDEQGNLHPAVYSVMQQSVATVIEEYQQSDPRITQVLVY